ncbi:hypothetical protein MRX96_054860 [Rhipicephalus microplus]
MVPFSGRTQLKRRSKSKVARPFPKTDRCSECGPLQARRMQQEDEFFGTKCHSFFCVTKDRRCFENAHTK